MAQSTVDAGVLPFARFKRRCERHRNEARCAWCATGKSVPCPHRKPSSPVEKSENRKEAVEENRCAGGRQWCPGLIRPADETFGGSKHQSNCIDQACLLLLLSQHPTRHLARSCGDTTPAWRWLPNSTRCIIFSSSDAFSKGRGTGGRFCVFCNYAHHIRGSRLSTSYKLPSSLVSHLFQCFAHIIRVDKGEPAIQSIRRLC